MIELSIRPRDWMSIFVIGLAFSAALSLLGYHLLALPPRDGIVFGVGLGFFITLCSFLFITLMNRFLLPKLPKIWWDPVAALFSFASGFLGFWAAHVLMETLQIAQVPMSTEHPYLTASFIGILTYLIGALNYRFVKTRNEKEELDTLWMQSRIRSLETQLNPHFLFNALNSLAELIHHDPVAAENAVLKISSFLRSTMKEATLIPLSEELRNAKDYIELENLRFGGKVTFHSTGQVSFLNVPKFSIQLLCENAIKHGYRGDSDLTITLSIDKKGEQTMIQVANNGKPLTSKHFGIGLSNLNERLHHLCDSELRITSADPVCYTFILKECHENSDRR